MLSDTDWRQTIVRQVAEAAELDRALEAALRGFCEATGWDYGEVWLAPLSEQVAWEEAPAVTLAATWHRDSELLSRFRDESASDGGFERGEGLVGRVWSSGEPHSVADVSEDPLYTRASVARQAGLKEALALPLVARDEVAGVMVFYHDESGTEGEGLVDDASSIAAQLGAIVREKQVRDDRDRFFELSMDMLCVAGTDGHFRRVNQAFVDTLGYSREELLTTPFAELIHPDDVGSTVREVERLDRGEDSVDFLNRYRTADGEWRWLEWRSRSQGDLIYAVARDVTERERDRRALAERVKEQSCLYDVATLLRDGRRPLEERLEAVVDRIPEGWQHPEATVARLVIDGREYASGAWREEGPALRAPVETATARLGRLEVRIRGEPGPADSGPFLEEEQRLLEEIADRIGAEVAQVQTYRELEEIEKRLRLLTENVDAVLYQWDTSTDPPRFLYVSSAYEEIWGRPVAELYENPMAFVEAMVPEDRERFEGITDDRWSSPVEITYRIRRPDGSIRWIRDQSHPVEAEEGRGSRLVGLAEDVTEQKELEQRLRQSNRDLEQFAYVASHDLQEPLRMVSGYLELIEERYADRLDDEAHEFIDYAVDGALRMKKMIADLLDYSRVNTRGKEPEPVEAGDALDEALSGLRTLAEDSGAGITKGELPTVLADEGQLVRVFQNLVANAIRHGGEGVRVRVTAERRGDRWRFSVADDGPGIPPEQHERIFKIFESLQRPDGQQSTGIGLAICRRIVERHGGRIWVESGDGATFHFTMPAATTAAGASEPREEEP